MYFFEICNTNVFLHYTETMKENKLAYILFQGIHEGDGVSNKIHSQIKAFKKNNFKVDFSYLTQENGFLSNRYYNKTLIDVAKSSYYSKKYGYKYRYHALYNKLIAEKINVVYIRYTHFANPLFILFLSKLKKKKIKILLEIPTFPYDDEYKSVKIKQKAFLKIENISRLFFKYYCDKIITLSSDKNIFGTPTIIISNGIEVDSIRVRKPHKTTNEYRLMGVADLRFWHGFDRIIEGLKDYYTNEVTKTKVYFDIIGNRNNKESEEYKELVKKYKLDEYVTFNGIVETDKLSPFYDNADLAVGSLGIHRKGLKEAKSIKSREYCAKGIPFIYAGIDSDFENKDFILKVPADDSNININAILTFLKESNFSTKEERKYAENFLTWDSQVKKIIDQM